jgi:hypothetical protein
VCVCVCVFVCVCKLKTVLLVFDFFVLCEYIKSFLSLILSLIGNKT